MEILFTDLKNSPAGLGLVFGNILERQVFEQYSILNLFSVVFFYWAKYC